MFSTSFLTYTYFLLRIHSVWGLWGFLPIFCVNLCNIYINHWKIISLPQGPIEPDGKCFLELYLVMTGLQERYRKTHEESNKV